MINRIPPSQIIVVDDKTEAEALPLLKSLFKIGLPTLYFTGSPGELPVKPLRGIRLLFLDLRLGFGGTRTRVNVTAAAAVVKKLMSSENGPYVLVAWTKHPKEMDDLMPLLEVQPTASIALDKNGCIVDGVCNLARVMAEVQVKLSGNGPVELLLFWECLVANASTSTVNQLCRWAADVQSVGAILYRTAVAGLGDHVTAVSDSQRTRAALEVLKSLLSDSIETYLNDAKLDSFQPLNQVGNATAESISRLNSKLLLGHVNDDNPYPGNVYREFQKRRETKTKVFFRKRVPFEKIRKHIKPWVCEANKTTISKLKEPEREKLFDEAASKFEAEILEHCPCVFAEITPICDHAQATCKKYRIIPGFLLKHEHLDLLDKNQNDIGYFVSDALFLSEFDGIYFLILDFRGLETVSLGYLAKRKPLFRLRQDFLFDVQHKAGSHFSRPGITSLRL